MSTLSKFFKFTEMAEYSRLKLPEGVSINYSGYASNKCVIYRSENIHIRIEKDNGWIHSVPEEMKEFVELHIKKIKDIIKYYKSIEVEKSYYNMQKAKEIDEKNKKRQAHEDEKKKLFKMFKK